MPVDVREYYQETPRDMYQEVVRGTQQGRIYCHDLAARASLRHCRYCRVPDQESVEQVAHNTYLEVEAYLDSYYGTARYSGQYAVEISDEDRLQFPALVDQHASRHAHRIQRGYKRDNGLRAQIADRYLEETEAAGEYTEYTYYLREIVVRALTTMQPKQYGDILVDRYAYAYSVEAIREKYGYKSLESAANAVRIAEEKIGPHIVALVIVARATIGPGDPDARARKKAYDWFLGIALQTEAAGILRAVGAR